MWAGLMAAVADELHTVAYDCRCFGRSETSVEGEYSDVDDLVSVLDGHGLDSVVLVGASRGGRIALDFALAHPGRVRGLFLIAPDVSGFEASASADEQALLDAIEAADEAGDLERIIALEGQLHVDGPTRAADVSREEIRRLVAEMSRVNYALQQSTPDFTDPGPAAGRLAGMACPVHVLVGTADTTGMREMAAAIARTCPGATLTEVPDAAHMLVLERPDVVESELRSWLPPR
ncbi:hypothetical protein GCM10022222_59490 [Amycolatopsis ultiminotia]|uniref:AB hydrolase-1 domain-containing protein n=2 Tax=Amycolatopsis ultiminotia TaxID=543629 RepID=A0ABP6XI41_9PSEU